MNATTKCHRISVIIFSKIVKFVVLISSISNDPFIRLHQPSNTMNSLLQKVLAQKVINGDNDTCQHMHLISRWLKIPTFYFSYLEILITCFFAESQHLSRIKSRIISRFFRKHPCWWRICNITMSPPSLSSSIWFRNTSQFGVIIRKNCPG